MAHALQVSSIGVKSLHVVSATTNDIRTSGRRSVPVSGLSGLRCRHVTARRNSASISFQAWTKGVQRSRGRVRMEASPVKEAEKKGDDMVDDQILQYCDINKRKKSLGEMEQDFLLALQAFYLNETPVMSNEDFDNLKEELQWQGSKVVMLSADEQRFMEASLAYTAGKPAMGDEEYDNLKSKLRAQGSKVAVQGPRCSIRSRKVYSDSQVDYLRMTLLNLPAALVALGIVFLFDDVTGFEITYLLELPEPYSFIFTWFVVLPITYFLASSLTGLVLKDFLILTGPCPNCGNKTVSSFGTILTVANSQRQNEVKCDSCGAIITYDLDTRMITLEDSKPEQKKAPPPKAKKAVAKA